VCVLSAVGLDEGLAFTRRADARRRTDAQWEELGVSAQELVTNVDIWLRLVQEGGHERTAGQVQAILEDLGPMPNPDQRPGALAMWVGALINPLPSLGVAWEVRPALLRAMSSEQRVELAIEAIEASIAHLMLLGSRSSGDDDP